MERLQHYNNSHCNGRRCMPDDFNRRPMTKVAPTATAAAGLVWLPWLGSKVPSECDTDRGDASAAPEAGLHSSLGPPQISMHNGSPTIEVSGWAFDTSFPDGGGTTVSVALFVDGRPVPGLQTIAADEDQDRKHTGNFMDKTGAPDAFRGFHATLSGGSVATLLSVGSHSISAFAYDAPVDDEGFGLQGVSKTELTRSPRCFMDGQLVDKCPSGHE